jgi:divalent anion:Na+ symporter, DASS family
LQHNLYPAFLGVAITVGAPPLLAALSFAFFSSLSAALRHNGAGPAVLIYGAGYVSQLRWWRIGFALSLVHLPPWLGIGLGWRKLLGLWASKVFLTRKRMKL